MKKGFIFKTTYLVFLFFLITGSNLYFGGITFKYVITLFLFALVLWKDKAIKLDNCFIFYIGFIFIFFLSSVFVGELDSFLNTFLRFYFPAYVGLRSTHIIIDKDFSFAKIILCLLLSIGLFDVAVTYSQFTLNASWYTPIRDFFQFPINEDFEDFVSNRSWLTTKSLASGVFGSAPINGYYLGLSCVLSLYPYLLTKKLLYLLLPSVFLVGLFVCQERSPLFLSVLLLGFVMFMSMPSLNTDKKLLLLLGIFSIIVFGFEYVANLSEDIGMRFTERGLDDTGREEIRREFWDYFASNPLFPNYYDLLNKGYRPPHNLFLNALVYGGPISFVLIMCILFIQTRRAWEIIKNMNKTKDYLLVAFTIGWIGFSANSLLHNRSVVTGELLLWVLWAIMSHKRTAKKYYNQK